MPNAIYQKFAVTDQGPWVLEWPSGYQWTPKQGYTYYTGYTFDGKTGSFTLTGDTFSDTIQERRDGYRLENGTPLHIATYEDSAREGDNIIWTGTITRQPDRPDRYQKAGLVGTVELPYGSVPEDGVQDGYWYVFQRMATPLWAKVGGVWYPGSGLYGKVYGVWKNEAKLSARVYGVWY